MADGDSSDTLQGEDDAHGAGAAGASTLLTGDKAAKDNTGVGRWTQEEHRLFLKGLELHGKGWKKIASLIKTRTVVQIRTHAQKYFLKLQKAQQNGDSAGPIMMDGKSLAVQSTRKKSTKSRRISDKPLAIADVLKPYVDAEDDGQPDQHIYRFLSAPLDDSGHSPVSITESGSNSNSGDQSNPALARPKRSRTNLDCDHVQGVIVPEWFKKGGELTSLLEKASTLDWTAYPAPAAMPLPSPITCNVPFPVNTTTSSECLEAAVESSLSDTNTSALKPDRGWLNPETFEYLQYVVEDDQPNSENVITESNSRKRARTAGAEDYLFGLHVPEDLPVSHHHTSVGHTIQTHSPMELESVAHGTTSDCPPPMEVETGTSDHVIDSFAITNDFFDDEAFSLEAMLAGET